MTDERHGSHDDGKLLYCSFCGKSQHEVRKLIAGPSVFICDECIELCNDIIRDEIAAEPSGAAKRELPAPKEIREMLDQYVIGQDSAKKILAVAAGAEPKIVHVPSDLISAYDPEWGAGLLGDKAHSAVFDNTKIKQFVPDYNCEVMWAEGLRRSLAWFASHPEFQTVDDTANSLWERIITAYESAFV